MKLAVGLGVGVHVFQVKMSLEIDKLQWADYTRLYVKEIALLITVLSNEVISG